MYVRIISNVSLSSCAPVTCTGGFSPEGILLPLLTVATEQQRRTPEGIAMQASDYEKAQSSPMTLYSVVIIFSIKSFVKIKMLIIKNDILIISKTFWIKHISFKGSSISFKIRRVCFWWRAIFLSCLTLSQYLCINIYILLCFYDPVFHHKV